MEDDHMKTLAMTLAALGLAGTAISPAFASNSEMMTVKVQYNDLNLASPEGQKTLDQRIEKAVRTVCRTQSVTTGSRIPTPDVKACLAKARADVRQQVAALTRVEQRGA
jgi:UrcA family protein